MVQNRDIVTMEYW